MTALISTTDYFDDYISTLVYLQLLCYESLHFIFSQNEMLATMYELMI